MTLKTKPGDLVRAFPGLVDPDGLDEAGLEIRAHGYLKKDLVPIIFHHPQHGIVIKSKHFSLCPDWAKRWPFEYETYNARLTRPRKFKNLETGLWEIQLHTEVRPQFETIAEVPSFRDAFSRGQTCLVPLTGAVESCYFGLSAGKIVRFEHSKFGLFFAAGLWNDWLNPNTGEFVPTFTLLTDDPDPIVYSHGHDRSIISIDHGQFADWLEKKMDARSRFEFLRSARILPDWKVVVEREMKSGWNKRAPTQNDIAKIEVWHGR